MAANAGVTESPTFGMGGMQDALVSSPAIAELTSGHGRHLAESKRTVSKRKTTQPSHTAAPPTAWRHPTASPYSDDTGSEGVDEEDGPQDDMDLEDDSQPEPAKRSKPRKKRGDGEDEEDEKWEPWQKAPQEMVVAQPNRSGGGGGTNPGDMTNSKAFSVLTPQQVIQAKTGPLAQWLEKHAQIQALKRRLEVMEADFVQLTTNVKVWMQESKLSKISMNSLWGKASDEEKLRVGGTSGFVQLQKYHQKAPMNKKTLAMCLLKGIAFEYKEPEAEVRRKIKQWEDIWTGHLPRKASVRLRRFIPQTKNRFGGVAAAAAAAAATATVSARMPVVKEDDSSDHDMGRGRGADTPTSVASPSPTANLQRMSHAREGKHPFPSPGGTNTVVASPRSSGGGTSTVSGPRVLTPGPAFVTRASNLPIDPRTALAPPRTAPLTESATNQFG